MKKLLAAALFLLVAASAESSTVKIDLDEHNCMICGETVLCFKGDPLDKIPVEDQPKKVRQLADKSKLLKECKNGYKMHRFVKRGTRNVNAELIAQNMNRIAVIDGGGTLGQKLYGWKCLLCGKEYFSFFGDKLNIKDWDVQPDNIKSVKGMRGIEQCSKRSDSSGYFGHVFKLTQEGPMTSWGFANSRILDNMYYVK